jgi:hypothetical protein
MGSELKKRPSEITQQPETDQSLFVDKEDEFIGGGFASLDEILVAKGKAALGSWRNANFLYAFTF